ncbi:MAG: hypothetical protein AAF420_13425 [Pseudomonadota bacterium]
MTISKLRAFTIHLSISLVIFVVLSWFLLFRWFPGELFHIDGGWQGMRIIAAVDLVLGPMLTLIFYKPGKPKVVFDLSMIAAVQVIALVYGVWSAHAQSTVALAFVEGRFVTVANAALKAGDAEMQALDLPIQSLDDVDQHLPAQIWVVAPSQDSLNLYYNEVLSGMPELHERSRRFRKLSENIDKILPYEVTLASLKNQSPAQHDATVTYFSEHAVSAQTHRIFKLKARYGRALAFVSRESGIIDDLMVVPEALQ